jgi:hypothetical protein
MWKMPVQFDGHLGAPEGIFDCGQSRRPTDEHRNEANPPPENQRDNRMPATEKSIAMQMADALSKMLGSGLATCKVLKRLGAQFPDAIPTDVIRAFGIAQDRAHISMLLDSEEDAAEIAAQAFRDGELERRGRTN